MTFRALLVLALTLIAEPALAHSPPLGIPGFFGGLLHPLFVPAHMLAILALGLLIGQQTSWSRLAAIYFIVGLAAGLAVMTFGVVPVLMNEAILAYALIAGLLVGFARPAPEHAGCGLAALVGFCIALDSPPEVISVREANLMLVGTGLGGTMLAAAVVAIASQLQSRLARVAARVLGSWIAASAILVLALRFVR